MSIICLINIHPVSFGESHTIDKSASIVEQSEGFTLVNVFDYSKSPVLCIFASLDGTRKSNLLFDNQWTIKTSAGRYAFEQVKFKAKTIFPILTFDSVLILLSLNATSLITGFLEKFRYLEFIDLKFIEFISVEL